MVEGIARDIERVALNVDDVVIVDVDDGGGGTAVIIVAVGAAVHVEIPFPPRNGSNGTVNL